MIIACHTARRAMCFVFMPEGALKNANHGAMPDCVAERVGEGELLLDEQHLPLVSQTDEFVFKTRNCVSKTANCAFKMMNFAAVEQDDALELRRGAPTAAGVGSSQIVNQKANQKSRQNNAPFYVVPKEL